MTHLYKIKNKRGQLITFRPNEVQLRHLADRRRRKRARILKYRQGGFSTLYLIDYLDNAIWTPGYAAAIIAHEQKALDGLFETVKRAYDNMPETLKPTTRQDTQRSFTFEFAYDGQKLDSKIYVALKIRSGTVQDLHISERAYIEGDKSQELEAGSKQAVPLDGRITEETTANGFNEYYDSFMESWENEAPGEYDYGAFFYAWHEMAEYQIPGPPITDYTDAQERLKALVRKEYGKELTDAQIYWYEWKKKELIAAARKSDDKVRLSGDQLMKQEYPTTVREAFQSGLGNVFDGDILDEYEGRDPIRVAKWNSEEIYIWREPVIAGQKYRDETGKELTHQKTMFYGQGCDPSDGVGGDDAGISVWDEQYRQCAQWYGQLRPDRLAELNIFIAEMYGNAFLGVENNMLSTILFVVEKGYKNYYQTVRIDERRKIKTKKIGWTTSSKTRDVMIDTYVQMFEEHDLEINSKKTLNQMMTFVKKEGGKREHAEGKHDDVLFSDFIAIQMVRNKDKVRTHQRGFGAKPSGM